MRRIQAFIVFLPALLGLLIPSNWNLWASDFMVYSVYRELNLGNPGEISQKDFYVNMGIAQGVHEGTILEVVRRVPTYDLLNERLYRDMMLPVGLLKVIHVEQAAAVARIEKMPDHDKAPITNPRMVVVGDLVRISKK